MVFFTSYRTKHESTAGDQFWKFSRQCSIFGRIGDQWVAILSPGSYGVLLKCHCNQILNTHFFYIFIQNRSFSDILANCTISENLWPPLIFLVPSLGENWRKKNVIF